MQLMLDTDTESLSGLRAALYLIEQIIDSRQPNSPPPELSTSDANAAAQAFGVSISVESLTPSNIIPGEAIQPTSSDERDSAGLPWDARIHSETRAKNKDGTWRFRRNLEESFKTFVLAELQGAITVSPPPVIAQEPAPGSVVEVAPITVPLPPPSTVPVPPPPALGVSDSTNPEVVSPAAMTFRDLMTKVNRALAAGTLTQPKLVEVCKSVGLDGVVGLATNPGKVGLVAASLGLA